ncbi:HAMP domain-containing sensor histidine kinase [Stigmatella sp. ncwal1]|uniref:histidine kinase n=1 Tax=Stigmatella ashevillensis TaxID=2995309 RepID=A0ABT5DE75_9BACT|nr:HAMP domain-containing sensor histidine kinase [Stigmatella ashevillena]MDC0711418.1 HAMP domain-containing sensor histidine kinase [Stigmatella ashevillena]
MNLSAAFLLSGACVAIAVALQTLRLGRRGGAGVVLLASFLALWMMGMFLLELRTGELADRVLPLGMLLAAAFVQAAKDVMGQAPRWLVPLAWSGSLAVALTGLIAPRLLYGPGASGAGPAFWPLAVVSAAATLAMNLRLVALVRGAQGRERRRRLALLGANVFGALGGGGLIGLHVLGVSLTGWGVLFLAVSLSLVAYASWAPEDLREREGLIQAAVQSAGFALLMALATAAASAILGVRPVWVAALLGAAGALPVDASRQLLVEAVTRKLFARPQIVPLLVEAVEKQTSRAEHAETLAEVGRLASAVAHEIRNPLGVILAEAKLLELSGADQESVQAIRNQVSRASRFVEDLLHYSRPRPSQMSEQALEQVVAEAVSRARQAFGDAAPEVSLDLEPLRWDVDGEALGDVVVNLVTNALIAVETIPLGRVQLTQRRVAEGVHIEVEDNGPGVPEALLPRLFEPFVTGRGRDARHPGTGLGLALCRKWVQRHGGTLTHARPATGGARFVIVLPRP